MGTALWRFNANVVRPAGAFSVVHYINISSGLVNRAGNYALGPLEYGFSWGLLICAMLQPERGGGGEGASDAVRSMWRRAIDPSGARSRRAAAILLPPGAA